MTDSALDLECPNCGYDLRGTADPPCPECGDQFTWFDVQARAAEQVDVKLVMKVAILSGVVPVLTIITVPLTIAGEVSRWVSAGAGLIALMLGYHAMHLMLHRSKACRKFRPVAIIGLLIGGASVMACLLATVGWVMW